MTAKRFEKSISSIEKYRIYDNQKEDAYFVSCDEHTVDCIVELLNELHEQSKMDDRIANDLLEAKEQLEDDSTIIMLMKLKKENKELKKKNDILIKQRLGEERLKQEIADYHTSNGKLHRLNSELIRRLDEFNIEYRSILRDLE